MTPQASHSPDIRKHGGRGPNCANVTSLWIFFPSEKKKWKWCPGRLSPQSTAKLAETSSLHLSWLLVNCFPANRIRSDEFRPLKTTVSDPDNPEKSWATVLRRRHFTASHIKHLPCEASKQQMFDVICNLRTAVCETIAVRVLEYIILTENIP